MREGLRTAHQVGSPDMDSPFLKAATPNQTFRIGRTCEGFALRDGCGTVLCRYNPGPLCYCCTRRQRDYERLLRSQVIAA